MNVTRAVSLVEKNGILLVYPLANRTEPRSLWGEQYGDEPMVWEWDDEGDGRVHELWHLRTRLTESRKVVYAKWFRGRATMFSRAVFRAMLATVRAAGDPRRGLSAAARELLETVEDDSPLSTRELKRRAGLQGRASEATFQRAMGELWGRLLIVGAGEVDDGAFPSLAVGATELLFDDLWLDSAALRPDDTALLQATFARAPLFQKSFQRSLASLSPA